MISSTRFLVLDHDNTVPFIFRNEALAKVRIEGGEGREEEREEELRVVSRGNTHRKGIKEEQIPVQWPGRDGPPVLATPGLLIGPGFPLSFFLRPP